MLWMDFVIRCYVMTMLFDGLFLCDPLALSLYIDFCTCTGAPQL